MQDRAEGEWGELASTTVLKWIPKCITGLTLCTPVKETSGELYQPKVTEKGRAVANIAAQVQTNPNLTITESRLSLSGGHIYTYTLVACLGLILCILEHSNVGLQTMGQGNVNICK